ncbi:HpcH/HpaI aldolase/citrate lyase family protein [Superficieibacter sp. HKU1]|uniref:HpcH/HpaI aldolase/citrate lyase family protein n=1 Tax=Superficieibacter sp. HKU1 TaxID=3031919 RepID=UPI0023E215F8|nr:HpcH/HpaI aldolase/citrate lyase family protein [Superficieibacter sp. HKU1]WES70466.1 HpcH/HpaI aldolase/citrate lyase family protein [Superficieibacter sp. HKU1]
MMKRLSPWNLGATLYMPATRTDIADAILNVKVEGLRSLVICLEDAVSEEDVPAALSNLQVLLDVLAKAKATDGSSHWPLVFIRPRDVEMGAQLARTLNLSPVDGLVLPKFTLASLPAWWAFIQHTHLCIMPTLETEEVFDVEQMRQLAMSLLDHPCHQRLIALRIGGNDLMNVIALRRPRHLTLYDGPMGYVIKMLVSVFATRGFALTAPVCEHIDDHDIMDKELALDMAHGLVGKTAIHPNQISKIEAALRVSDNDYADALRILNSSQAVFKSLGAMCEPATHRRWASAVIERAQVYGIISEREHGGIVRVPLSQQS